MGQSQTFIPYISAGNYNEKVIFGKDPFLRMLFFENGAKSHNFTNLFFVTSHLTHFRPFSRGKKIKTPVLIKKPFFHYKLISEHMKIYIRLKGY